ncbi:MAG: hypothetical protein AABZ33_10790 [Chloroflexota bacterium]
MIPKLHFRVATGSWPAHIGLAVAAAALALAVAAPVAALAPVPLPGAAVIDGDPSEWTSGDLFTTMQHHGSAKVVGTFSLRYDCATQILSALVLSTDGAIFKSDRPEVAFLRIDGAGKLVSGESGDDGIPPDFAWVGQIGSAARGFEASGVVLPGEHTIRAHILMFDDSADGYLTIDSNPPTGPLSLSCPSATSGPSGSVAAFTATPTVGPTPTPSGSQDRATHPGTTPPPTDLGSGTGAIPPITSLWLMVVGLSLLNVVAFLVARRRARRAGARATYRIDW